MLHSWCAIAPAAGIRVLGLTVALAISACGTPMADTTSTPASRPETIALTPSPAEASLPSPEATLAPADYPTGAGEWIVYQGVFGEWVDLGLVRPDGSGGHRIPQGEWERWHPAWSPDGTRILYDRWDPATEQAGLAVVALDGSDDRLILDCVSLCLAIEHPAWAPDGEAIAFAGVRGEDWGAPDMACHLGVVVESGEVSYPLEESGCKFSHMSPRFSPDGERIVFKRIDEEAAASALFTIARDGGDLRQLTDWGFGARPHWSPDGEWIVFMREEHTPEASFISLHRVRPDGTGLEQLTEPSAASDVYPRWLPDGSGILFSRCVGMWTCATRVIAPDGSNDRLLFQELGAQTVHVIWQPSRTGD
jgi:Tol biopolymer transport system component